MTDTLRLAHPEWLTPLVACALAALGAVAGARRVARRRRQRLLGRARRPRGAHLESDAALLLALIAIAIALLGPRLGERTLRVPGSGVDVVFAVDVSRSMDARDVPPSRLARARRAVAELLARLAPADRAGLVAYAGRGVLLAPLTPDRDALRELLSALDSGLLQPPASDVGAGVRAALEAFEPGAGRPRVVFVLGDGEDPQRGGDLGAAEARGAGARVLAAALGSDAGATVPDHGVPLRDARGDVVVSRRRSERLARLAQATGGELFEADAWGAFDLERAVSALRRDAAAAPGEWLERRVAAVRVAPFAALAFALLLVEGLPRPRAGRAAARGLALAAAALVGLAAGGESGGDARALLATGLEALEHGRHEVAARAFLAAAVRAPDSETGALAYYDLGVTALESGDLEAARDAFFDALALRPGDRRTRFNLEWTLQALERRTPPPPRQSPPPPPEPPPAQREPEPPEESRPTPMPKPIAEAQRERLLARVPDDPERALRSAAAEPGAPARGAGPVW